MVLDGRIGKTQWWPVFHEETAITVSRNSSRNGNCCAGVDLGHGLYLVFPIDFVVLDYAEGIYP